MKTLPILFLLAVFLTFVAWISLQGVSQAEPLTSTVVPLAAPELPPQRSSAPRKDTKPPKKSAAYRAPAPTPLKPSPLQIALQAGDLCETAKLLEEENIAMKMVYAAILATISPSAALVETFGANGVSGNEFVFEGMQKLTHPGTRFIAALQLGGLSNMGSAKTPDVKKARELLLALEKENPGNAAYPYFRLALEEKLGFKREELLATANEAADGSFFDTHFDEINREMLNARWLNPALHYALRRYYYADSFNFYPGTDVIRSLQADQNFGGSARIAKLMTDPGMKASRPADSGEYYNLQYIYGRLLDKNSYKDFDEFDKEKGGAGYTPEPPIFAEQAGQRFCDPGPYEAFFYERRNSR